MTAQTAIDIFRHALMTTFWTSLPLLLLGFVAGIVMSLIQVITSIQDNSFAAVPRLTAFFLGLLILMPWMTARLMSYTAGLLGDFSRYAR